MAHPAALRAAVRRSYITDRQPLTAAAKRHGVPYATARGWKRDAMTHGDDWDHARLAHQLAEGGVQELTRLVLEEFAPLFRSTIQAIGQSHMTAGDKADALARLSDAFSKAVKASGAVDPSVAKLAWAMDVVRLLSQFVAEKFPQHQSAVIEILEPFGERLAREFA